MLEPIRNLRLATLLVALLLGCANASMAQHRHHVEIKLDAAVNAETTGNIDIDEDKDYYAVSTKAKEDKKTEEEEEAEDYAELKAAAAKADAAKADKGNKDDEVEEVEEPKEPLVKDVKNLVHLKATSVKADEEETDAEKADDADEAKDTEEEGDDAKDDEEDAADDKENAEKENVNFVKKDEVDEKIFVNADEQEARHDREKNNKELELEHAMMERAAVVHEIESLEDKVAFESELNQDMKEVADETQSGHLAHFLGGMWKDMRMFASPFYQEYLKKKLKRADATIAKLEKDEEGATKATAAQEEDKKEDKEEDKKEDKTEAKGDSEEKKSTRKKAEAVSVTPDAPKSANYPPFYFTGIWLVTAGALCGAAYFLVAKNNP